MLRAIYTQDDIVKKEYEANDIYSYYNGLYAMVDPYDTNTLPLPQTKPQANRLPQTKEGTTDSYDEFLVILNNSSSNYTQAVFVPCEYRATAHTNGMGYDYNPGTSANWTPVVIYKTADSTNYLIYANGAASTTADISEEPVMTYIQNAFPSTSLFCFVKGGFSY